MKTHDHCPGAAQAALRKRAVQAVLGGMTQAEAARVFRVHPNAVNRWIKRYRDGGWDGLGEQRRGRRAGEQPALSERQQQEVMALVRDTTPDQLGLPGFLWTRDAVAELITRRYGLWLARTTVGGYLRGWGFSPQKPQRRALEQNPAVVRRWLAEEFRPSAPGPSARAEWCCDWMRWGSAQMRPPGGRGRQSARPRSSSGPASGSGST
jgi:transposase